jgi:TPR repeat protein
VEDRTIILSMEIMRDCQLAFMAIYLVLGCASGDAQTTTSGLDAPALFEKGMNALEGSSATRSPANAIDYFRRSSDLGFAPAQVALGYFYETGHNTASDPREGLEWYKKAARQQDPLAQWLVGRIIFLGEVPPRDLNQASSWLEKSSAQDNPFAEYLLGKIALERNDYTQAAKRFREAAQQGLPQAQRQLAMLLRDGQGVVLDKSAAYVWMLVSYEGGLRATRADVQALEAELSSTQLEDAKSRARAIEGGTARSAVAHGCTGWQGEFDVVPTPPPPDLQRFCR